MKFWKFVLGGMTFQAVRKVRKSDEQYPLFLKVIGVIIVIIVILIMIYW